MPSADNNTISKLFLSLLIILTKVFIYNDLKDKYNYTSEEECYADRHNHRKEWYDAICDYNVTDGAALGREMFAEYDIYCGLRNKREFFAMKNTSVFDYAIWVDRTDHLPTESKDSMSLEQWMADYTIDNNGDLQRLKKNVHILMQTIFKNQGLNLPASSGYLLSEALVDS